MTRLRIIAVLADVVLLSGTVSQPTAQRAGGAPTWRHEVVRSFPHDPDAFTQGLLVRDGYFYESTGRKGSSSLRKVAKKGARNGAWFRTEPKVTCRISRLSKLSSNVVNWSSGIEAGLGILESSAET